MDAVMQKARELAQAIRESGEWRQMHEAEVAAAENSEAKAAVALVMDRRRLVESLLESAEPDPEAIAKAGAQLEEAEAAMNGLAVIEEVRQRRGEFTQMMNTVNQVLELIVSGKIPQDSEGCSGSCATCGGCRP